MGDHRMFSKRVIGSARFLRMPASSRLLYYDLGMYADDDGVVEAFSVMRQTQATEDDLRVLVSKGFVSILNEDLVSVITDWKINNIIRKDRYHPSLYTNLLLQLQDISEVPDGFDNQLSTNCQPSDNQMEPEVKLSKDKLSKAKKSNSNNRRFTPPTVQQVQEYVDEKGYHIDAERFVDYYTSNGWKVGKNSMKDWKAAVRTWERNNYGNDTGRSYSERGSLRGDIRQREEEIRDDASSEYGGIPMAIGVFGDEGCRDHA